MSFAQVCFIVTGGRKWMILRLLLGLPEKTMEKRQLNTSTMHLPRSDYRSNIMYYGSGLYHNNAWVNIKLCLYET